MRKKMSKGGYRVRHFFFFHFPTYVFMNNLKVRGDDGC